MAESGSKSYKWIVLGVASVGSFMAPFDGSIVNIALPSITTSLQAELAYIAWVPTAYLLVIATMQTTLGKLADIKGRKNLYVFGLLIFGAASALCSFSTTILQLILFRVFQGVGAALMAANSVALVTGVFPPAERGKALGINTTALYLGLTTGPILGGLLVEHLGWRSIFYINIPISLVSASLAWWKFRQDRPSESEARFDLSGAMLFSASLASFLIFLTFGEDLGWVSPLILTLIAVSTVSFLVFIVHEGKVEEPMLDLRFFTKNRIFSSSNLSALLVYVTTIGVGFLLSFYLQVILRYSPAEAGMVLVAQPVMMVLFSPIAGWLYDRVGSRMLVGVGLMVRAFGIMLLAGLSITSTRIEVIIPLLFVGLGMGLYSSPNTSALMGSVPRTHLGVAAGTLGTMRTMGQSLGVTVSSVVVALYVGSEAFKNLTSHSGAIVDELVLNQLLMGFRAAFLVGVFITLIAMVIAIARGKEMMVKRQPSVSR